MTYFQLFINFTFLVQTAIQHCLSHSRMNLLHRQVLHCAAPSRSYAMHINSLQPCCSTFYMAVYFNK